MATTTGSESRAWESGMPEATQAPEPGDAHGLPGSAEMADADQTAMAAFAAEWTRSAKDADQGESGATAADTSVLTPASAQGRHYVRTAGDYAAQPGLPGRGLIVMSLAAAVGVVLADFALTGGLSMFFDLWFVVICLVGAMAVRRRDLFTAGVLAPLMFGGLIAAISLVAPATFSEVGGFGKVFPTGLTAHAGALVAGYAIALLTVGGRVAKRS